MVVAAKTHFGNKYEMYREGDGIPIFGYRTNQFREYGFCFRRVNHHEYQPSAMRTKDSSALRITSAVKIELLRSRPTYLTVVGTIHGDLSVYFSTGETKDHARVSKLYEHLRFPHTGKNLGMQHEIATLGELCTTLVAGPFVRGGPYPGTEHLRVFEFNTHSEGAVRVIAHNAPYDKRLDDKLIIETDTVGPITTRPTSASTPERIATIECDRVRDQIFQNWKLSKDTKFLDDNAGLIVRGEIEPLPPRKVTPVKRKR